MSNYTNFCLFRKQFIACIMIPEWEFKIYIYFSYVLTLFDLPQKDNRKRYATEAFSHKQNQIYM